MKLKKVEEVSKVAATRMASLTRGPRWILLSLVTKSDFHWGCGTSMWGGGIRHSDDLSWGLNFGDEICK